MRLCEHCGQVIEFAKNERGKWIPVEPGHYYYTPDDDARTFVLTGAGKIIHAVIERCGSYIGRVPHYPYCTYNVKAEAEKQKYRERAERKRLAAQKRAEK